MAEAIIDGRGDGHAWKIDASGAGLVTGSINVYAADESQRILTADDAVTTINYASSAKELVSNIVTASAVLTRKVTDTYNDSGATTLVITRVVANV